jgi:hypothetical protein
LETMLLAGPMLLVTEIELIDAASSFF